MIVVIRGLCIVHLGNLGSWLCHSNHFDDSHTTDLVYSNSLSSLSTSRITLHCVIVIFFIFQAAQHRNTQCGVSRRMNIITLITPLPKGSSNAVSSVSIAFKIRKSAAIEILAILSL